MNKCTKAVSAVMTGGFILVGAVLYAVKKAKRDLYRVHEYTKANIDKVQPAFDLD